MPKPHERDDTFVKRKEVTEKESTTPRLERLLPTSVRFSAAYAPMPTTLPSHSSMFTGRLPRSLGVLKNGQVLATSAVTLTEILRDHGYHTAAIVSSFVLNRRFGTAQGFDSYDDDFPETPCKLVGKSWERFDLEGSFCRRGNLTTDAAVTWLEKMGYLHGTAAPSKKATQPFFVWAHYFDPHYPYTPPEQDAALFPPRGENPSGLERSIAAYDSEIHFTDAQVGRLLDRLAADGILEDTVVIVAADHGEGLMRHGWMNHGLMIYEEAVRVPLPPKDAERLRALGYVP